MSEVCVALCLTYLGGFVSTFALAANYVFENRAGGREGFAGLRTLHVWCGSLVCAALWPVIVAAFAVSAVVMSLKNGRQRMSSIDTHGECGEGWIGFDLDGTLAMYDGWKGIDHIGAPIGPMVSLIKKYHAQGRRVKILTARIAPHRLEDGTVGEAYITVPKGDGGATRQYARQYINDWCHFNLGFVPEIVYAKDHLMLELYDDRVKQVEPNTGIVIEDELRMLRSAIANKTLEVAI